MAALEDNDQLLLVSMHLSLSALLDCIDPFQTRSHAMLAHAMQPPAALKRLLMQDEHGDLGEVTDETAAALGKLAVNRLFTRAVHAKHAVSIVYGVSVPHSWAAHVQPHAQRLICTLHAHHLQEAFVVQLAGRAQQSMQHAGRSELLYVDVCKCCCVHATCMHVCTLSAAQARTPFLKAGISAGDNCQKCTLPTYGWQPCWMPPVLHAVEAVKGWEAVADVLQGEHLLWHV